MVAEIDAHDAAMAQPAPAPQAPPLELASYTADEGAVQIQAQEEADTARAKQEAQQAAADKARTDKADTDARMEASADNFVLGQDANDAVSGQASVFDAPAELAPKSVAADAQPVSVVGKNDAKPAESAQPAEASPPKKKSVPARKKQEHEAKLAARADYFTPGNVVTNGMGGHDKVVSYTAPDANGNWSATVQAVEQQGGEWANVPGTKERKHSTEPTARELKAGPVQRAPDATENVAASAQPASATGQNDGESTTAYSDATKPKAIATAFDKQIMGMANNGRSARDMLRTIQMESGSKLNRQLAAVLLKMQAIPKVEAVGRIKNRKGGLVGGVYLGETDTVQLSLLGEAGAERTFMHEMVHAATIQSLRRGGMAAQRMKALFARVQKDSALAGEYGVTDVYEFVAELYSNERFRAALNTINDDTLWQNFVSIVRSVLGLSSDQKTALSDALMAGQQVMAEDKAIRGSQAGRAGGQFNSEPVEGNTEADRQFKETERAYGGRAAYDRAKAADKTRLTYGQWVQVRTPKFKAWFGDWEAQANNDFVNQQIDQWASGQLPANVILNIGRPSSVLTQHGVPNLPITLRQAILRKAVKDKHGVAATELKDIAQAVQSPIAIFDDPDNTGTRIAVTEIRHADGNIIAAIRLNIGRDGLEINDIRSLHPKRDSSVLRWVEDGLLLGLDKNKGRDWLENLAATNSQQPQAAFATLGEILYDADSVRNTSKVVDPDTGEPLVVYHGTGRDFAEFKEGKRQSLYGGGFYFGKDPQVASSFASPLRGPEPNVMPIYLSLQKPFIEDSNYSKTPKVPELKAKGYDGIVALDGQIVAFYPEQIKSATGNNGEFDRANPDIRFSRAPSTQKTQTTIQPQDFVLNADGSLDYGEITPEMGRAMRRQAGKIRLQQGNERFGLAHIEARHGDEIRKAGFASIQEFVADIAKNIDQMWKPDATSQLVALHVVKNDRVMFVQLQPESAGGQDFYTVNTAFPSRAGYVANKKNWKMLWEGRAQPSQSATSEQTPFAVPPQKTGKAATFPSDQSAASVAPKDGTANYARADAPMSPDLARAILALGQPAQSATKESVRAAVRELVNGGGLLPNRLGRVVVATAAEIKAHWEPLIGPVAMEAEGAGRAQGFYDPKTKTVFLIADHIQAGDELGVVAHELMHKHGPAVLGEEGWNRLHSAIEGWATAAKGSMERTVYDEAAQRVQASGPELSSQELFPYAVQVALEMGVRPNAIAPKGSVERWLGQVRAALRHVWSKIATQKSDFKSLDLVNLAFAIAQRENPAHAVELDGAVVRSDADKAKVLQGEPVAVLRLEDAPAGGYADVARWAADLFKQQGSRAISPEIGEVMLNEQSARDSMAHGGANAAKKIAFAAVKDVIERGTLVHQASHGRKESFYISAPVRISGRDNIVTALVRRDHNTQRMYLHSVALKENLLKPRVSSVDAKKASERSGSTTSGEVSTVANGGQQGKVATADVARELTRRLTLDTGQSDAPLFSRATSSVPESVAEWLSDTVIADEVENRINSFAHQPPIRIRDTAFGQLPGVARNDNVAGAVHDGAIYLSATSWATGGGGAKDFVP